MTLSFKPRSPAVRVVLEVVAPFRGRLLAAMGLMLLQSGVVLLAPWMIGRFSQALLLHEPVSAWLGGLLAVVVVQAALGYAVGVHLQGAASRMIEGLSLRVYAHLQVLPLAWHRERRRGAVLALLTEDVYRVGRFVTGAAIPLIPLMVMCAGAAAMMLGVQPALALAVLALVPAAFIGLRWAGRRLRPLAQQVVDAYAMTTSLAEQGLSLLPVTKAFAAEGTELQRYAESVGRLRHWEMRQVRAQDAIAPVVRVLVVAAVLAMLAWGARLVAAGSLAAADLVTLLMYGLMLGQPISQLAAVYGQVQTAKGTLHRLDDLFAQAPEPDSGQLELPAPLGEIRLEGVCFGYPGRGRVLDGVDLHVPAAGTIAIIGANGAGKSTLIQLMMRFHDPEAGRITLDGVDVRQLRLAHLRSMFGLVSQQILLLNGTVRENIAYGCPDATDPVINEAARLARASEFIAQLPDGLDTVVGDDGLRLSGGQRQRLALARALLRDPRVLILDEATAMFDPLAETAFVEEMLGRRGGRTVILVTHRPASLVLAERVYELSDGRLRLVSP